MELKDKKSRIELVVSRLLQNKSDEFTDDEYKKLKNLFKKLKSLEIDKNEEIYILESEKIVFLAQK